MRLFLSLFLLCAVYSQHFARKRYRASINLVPIGTPVVPYPLPSTTSTPDTQAQDEHDKEDKKEGTVDSDFKYTEADLLANWLDWSLGLWIPSSTSTTTTLPPLDGRNERDEFSDDRMDGTIGKDREIAPTSTPTPPVDDYKIGETTNATKWPEADTKRRSVLDEVCFLFPGKIKILKPLSNYFYGLTSILMYLPLASELAFR
jgi:hypothetical protein